MATDSLVVYNYQNERTSRPLTNKLIRRDNGYAIAFERER